MYRNCTRCSPRTAACTLLLFSCSRLASDGNLDGGFGQTVRPFIESYCVDCHSVAKPEAKFDIRPYDFSRSVVDDFGHWELVLDMLEEDEEHQPSPDLRARVVEWIRGIRRREAERNAGDPVIVLARRPVRFTTTLVARLWSDPVVALAHNTNTLANHRIRR